MGHVPGQPTSPPAAVRPDTSMALLTNLVEHPVDDGYAEAAARRRRSGDVAGGPHRMAMVLLGVGLAGLVLAVAAGQIRQDDAALSSERAALAERVGAGETANDALEQQVAALQQEVDRLQSGALAGEDDGGALQAQLEQLEVLTGARAVQGEGIRVVVDDAPAGEGDAVDDFGRVLDVDLQRLVNGLWAAGAEAVSINGQRITTLTAIRSANDVITVNYRPLIPPYDVLAIGDARTLGSRFAEGPGGDWFRTISSAHGIQFSVSTDDELTLPAASRTGLRYVDLGDS